MDTSSMREVLASNAQGSEELHGVAVMEVPDVDPGALPLASIHMASSSISSSGSSSKELLAAAMGIRAKVVWRSLYPPTAPPPASVAAPEAVTTTTGADEASKTAAAPSDAVRQDILTVVATAEKSSKQSGGLPSHSTASASGSRALVVMSKRGRDEDEILSVNPAKLKARSALVVSQAAAQEAEAQRYTPPPKWKLAKVLVGHQGWVWTTAVEPGNKWFATGGFDAIIKVWDLEMGTLKMNLTGHKEAVRSIALSKVSPYMFSGSDDHSVKCWDLERNEVVREFFGHKSSVHCVAAHPSLDVVISGSRDRTVRVFDLRTRAVVHTMTGHTDSVMSLVVQQEEPQVISGGSDGFIYLWDLASGKPVKRLTRHKKPVRGLALTASGSALVSCGADEVRVWDLPSGDFVTNASTRVADTAAKAEQQKEEEEFSYRWSCCAMSPHNVLALGSQDGEVAFYDWNRPQPRRVAGRHYAPYQWTKTKSLPGTLNGEGGINGMSYDLSGTRLITVESDKSVKMWRLRES
jgi:pleiotropic regulator 1